MSLSSSNVTMIVSPVSIRLGLNMYFNTFFLSSIMWTWLVRQITCSDELE